MFTKLIERNTTIPTRKSEVFSTADDSQTQVEIHVLQGEREMAAYNRTLGKFNLVGIPPAPRGVPQIEVTFDIDANGIVNVSAKDLATQNEQKIEIKASSGLSTRRSRTWCATPSRTRTRTGACAGSRTRANQAEARIHEAERQLKDNGDKIEDETRRDIEGAVSAAKLAVESEDADDIEAKAESLTQALHKMSEEIYRRASAEQPAGNGAGPEAETVEDAEYEIVDEDAPKSA